MPARRQTPKPDEILLLEIRHSGHAEGAFSLYDFDGEPWDYENGESSWTQLKATRDNSGRLQGDVEIADAAGRHQNWL